MHFSNWKDVLRESIWGASINAFGSEYCVQMELTEDYIYRRFYLADKMTIFSLVDIHLLCSS